MPTSILTCNGAFLPAL